MSSSPGGSNHLITGRFYSLNTDVVNPNKRQTAHETFAAAPPPRKLFSHFKSPVLGDPEPPNWVTQRGPNWASQNPASPRALSDFSHL